MKGLKRGIIIHAVMLAALGMNGAANAAASAKNIPHKLEPLSKEEFADMRKKLGICVIERNKALVAKFLANSDSVTTDYAAVGIPAQGFVFAFKMDVCQKFNPPQMAQYIAKPGILRSILLEQTYLAHEPSAPQQLLNDKGEPAPSPARKYVSKADQLASAASYGELADCTAQNGTALADTVLRTGAGMPEERTAAVALAPVIGQCIPAGLDIKLTPDTIRALAAEGLWQRYASASDSAHASVQ